MAFSKTNSAVATPPPAAEAPAVAAPAVSQKEDKAPLSQKRDTKVLGQVAMNAIQTGYETASRLVLTLSPKPTEAKELLHTLAAEIAEKIEAYSFRHD